MNGNETHIHSLHVPTKHKNYLIYPSVNTISRRSSRLQLKRSHCGIPIKQLQKMAKNVWVKSLAVLGRAKPNQIGFCDYTCDGDKSRYIIDLSTFLGPLF